MIYREFVLIFIIYCNESRDYFKLDFCVPYVCSDSVPTVYGCHTNRFLVYPNFGFSTQNIANIILFITSQVVYPEKSLNKF